MNWNPDITATVSLWEALRLIVGFSGVLVSAFVTVRESYRDVRATNGPTATRAQRVLAWITLRATGAVLVSQIALSLQALSVMSAPPNPDSFLTARNNILLLIPSVMLLAVSIVNNRARHAIANYLKERKSRGGIPSA
jgi:hypothetical protein